MNPSKKKGFSHNWFGLELRYEKGMPNNALGNTVKKLKNASQLKQAATPCLDDQQFNSEDLDIVLKCLSARLGRPDTSKWNWAQDKMLATLTSYMHFHCR